MIQLTAEAALRQTLGAAHNIASIRAGSDMPQPSSRIETQESAPAHWKCSRMSRAPTAMLLSMRSDTASGREYPVLPDQSRLALPRVLAFLDRRCSSLKQPGSEQRALGRLI